MLETPLLSPSESNTTTLPPLLGQTVVSSSEQQMNWLACYKVHVVWEIHIIKHQTHTWCLRMLHHEKNQRIEANSGNSKFGSVVSGSRETHTYQERQLQSFSLKCSLLQWHDTVLELSLKPIWTWWSSCADFPWWKNSPTVALSAAVLGQRARALCIILTRSFNCTHVSFLPRLSSLRAGKTSIPPFLSPTVSSREPGT